MAVAEGIDDTKRYAKLMASKLMASEDSALRSCTRWTGR